MKKHQLGQTLGSAGNEALMHFSSAPTLISGSCQAGEVSIDNGERSRSSPSHRLRQEQKLQTIYLKLASDESVQMSLGVMAHTVRPNALLNSAWFGYILANL